MTQIISCITEDYAIQVSDRCFVNPRTGRVVHEDRNKAVLYGRTLALAYTGFGQMPKKRTDLWATEELSSQTPVSAALEHLTTRTEAAVGQVRSLPPEQRFHAFVGTGFVNSSRGIDRKNRHREA